MFMVKDEFENIKKLLKVRFKVSIKNLKWFFIFAAFLFLSEFISTIVSIINDNGIVVKNYSMSDFSFSFFLGIVIVYFVIMLMYRSTNDYLSVLPQTNNSRFISSQLYNYLSAAVVLFTVLLIYFVEYGIFKLLSVFKENLVFVLNFNLEFIVVGFLTYIIYAFLIIALFGFIGSILRKWKLYAVLIFAMLFSLMIVNLNFVIEYFPKVFSFLINESIPLWFMIKGIGLWIIINGLSLLINYYTVYYKSQSKVRTVGIVAICAISAITAAIVPVFLFPHYVSSGTNIEMNTQMSEEDHYSRFTTAHIDLSDLPKGSSLKIVSDYIFLPEVNDDFNRDKHLFDLNNTEVLNNVNGDHLTIYYRFPVEIVNGYNIYDYVNPKLNFYLDGNVLHIDYSSESIHAIFLPIWGFARQFDCYSEKETFLPWSIMGGGSGYISFEVK